MLPISVELVLQILLFEVDQVRIEIPTLFQLYVHQSHNLLIQLQSQTKHSSQFINTNEYLIHLPCIDNAASSTSAPDGQSNLPVLISSFSCNTNKYLHTKKSQIDIKMNSPSLSFCLFTWLIHREDSVDRMCKI